MKRANKGLTLLEIIVVVGIFSGIFAAILSVMTASDLSFRTGQQKITEQQEGRQLMDTIVRMLRQTRREWVTIYSSHFAADDEILFYDPQFDVNGIMSAGPWVYIRPEPSDSTIIEMKKQGGQWKNVAYKNYGIRYGAGCAACASYNCTTPDASCPVVKIDIQTREGSGFNLTTFVTLRNAVNSAVGGSPPVQPDPGDLSG